MAPLRYQSSGPPSAALPPARVVGTGRTDHPVGLNHSGIPNSWSRSDSSAGQSGGPTGSKPFEPVEKLTLQLGARHRRRTKRRDDDQLQGAAVEDECTRVTVSGHASRAAPRIASSLTRDTTQEPDTAIGCDLTMLDRCAQAATLLAKLLLGPLHAGVRLFGRSPIYRFRDQWRQ